MLSEQQQRILGYFIEEAKDHLNTIEQGLLSLQATIKDSEMVSEVFRAAHSVKGGAAMLGLGSIQKTAHRLEDYFKILKECPIQIDQKLESLLLEVFDALKELLDQLQGPFGLTDDKAAEVMAGVEPVFSALNQHMSLLVSQSGTNPPEDVELDVLTTAAVVRTQATPAPTEESALQMVFQSDVPARLREMLQLFKQPDQLEVRQQLQSICQSLGRVGESFSLSAWVNLLDLARRAIANSDNSFRVLAPVVIREIKQSQDLVLSGRVGSIVPSEELRSLVPTPASLTSANADFADFFSANLEEDAPVLVDVNTGLDDLDLSTPDAAGDADDWFGDAAPEVSTVVGDRTIVNDNTLVQDDLFLSEAFDAISSPDASAGANPTHDLGFPAGWDEVPENADLLQDGPEVGMAELNSLADLFEGEMPDLGTMWQEEEIPTDSVIEPLETGNSEASSEFSDLFFNQDGLEDLPLPTTLDDEDLSGFFNQAEQAAAAAATRESSHLEKDAPIELPADEPPGLSSEFLRDDFGEPESSETPDQVFGDQDLGELGNFFAELDESEFTTTEDSDLQDQESSDLENLDVLFVPTDEALSTTLEELDPTDGIITAFSLEEEPDINDADESELLESDALLESEISFGGVGEGDALFGEFAGAEVVAEEPLEVLEASTDDADLMDSLFSGLDASETEDIPPPTGSWLDALDEDSEELLAVSEISEESSPLTGSWLDALDEDSEELLAVSEISEESSPLMGSWLDALDENPEELAPPETPEDTPPTTGSWLDALDTENPEEQLALDEDSEELAPLETPEDTPPTTGSWLDALDTENPEEQLSTLETAPPLWNGSDDDVTADLWAKPVEGNAAIAPSNPFETPSFDLSDGDLLDSDLNTEAGLSSADLMDLLNDEPAPLSTVDAAPEWVANTDTSDLWSSEALSSEDLPFHEQADPSEDLLFSEVTDHGSSEDFSSENLLSQQNTPQEAEESFGDLLELDALLGQEEAIAPEPEVLMEAAADDWDLLLDAPSETAGTTDASLTDAGTADESLDFEGLDFEVPEFETASAEATFGDLTDLDNLLSPGNFNDEENKTLSLTPDAISDDFMELDALLGQEAEDREMPESRLTDTVDFADLDALLEEVPVSEPFGDPVSEINPGNTASNRELLQPPAPIASQPPAPGLDDFSDLEALIANPPPTPARPAAGPSVPTADDDFQDLEKLLETAEQTFGGSQSTVRTAAVSPARRPSRAGVLTDQTMRVSVKNLDNLNNLVGELVVNRNSLEQAEERQRQFLDNLLYQVQQLSDVGQRMRDLYERSLLESSLLSSRRSYHNAGSSSGSSASTHATGVGFDPLEMDRFTGFHTLSQEMIELIVRVRESASDIDFVVDETDQITRNFRQITTQLQEGLTRSRMVPFAQTADRLPRAVRDISLRCGKQAELTVEGRETLIDKMILEQLYDPMTHLVNNAITHGIETPEERSALGKPAVGRITVRTFHQGNQTVISVTDDGAGIDPEKVKQKAVEKGLLKVREAQAMTRLDVYDLLFHHGFSTRDKADDFAGRGVGMDVVRTSLNEIRGTISIDSAVGRGTTFTIRLPLTLSISKALCCISNRARIAFPMDGVEDMLDVPRDRIQTDSEGHTSVQWRDQVLPFQHLSDLLKFNRSLGRGSVYGGNQEDDIISVVVLRSNAGSYLALQVDQVLGEQEIVIKQLEGPIPKPVGIAGATVLGDGRIMPIADVLELIDLSMGRIRREAGSALWDKGEEVPVEPVDTKTEPTVLIVDDSITVRELLSMTFNKVGYRVEQARDGQEAWEKLRSGLPCDLVFCDIEMPRMDGLELLSRMQKDPHLNHLPIAMLTSRGADRHRQMAIQLGAKGYFTKPYLEEVLLDAAQRMLKGEILVGNTTINN